MNTFYLRVISSNKIFFEGRVEKLILPLEDGEKAVLAHHENMVIATSIVEIRITREAGGYRQGQSQGGKDQSGRETQTERESEGIQAERGITCPCTHKTQSNRKDIKPSAETPSACLQAFGGFKRF